MRRLVSTLAGLGLLAGGVAVAQPAAAAPVTTTAVRSAHGLRTGDRLVSPDSRYRAAVERDGRFVVRTSAGRWVWSTPAAGSGATLYLARNGQLETTSGGHVRWSAGTAGSGSADVLTLRNSGVLALSSGGLTVWTSRARNACPHTRGKTFVVDLSAQVARMCSGGQQLRATPVTTGATAKGDGTPKGTWHVQAKVRHTTLYPAGGGAYPVKYWVPYDGAYGIHDSSWQHFAYGSKAYRTRGSHGCTHVPLKAMTWFFAWARVGSTTVTIHR